jgi:hypothetical protein
MSDQSLHALFPYMNLLEGNSGYLAFPDNSHVLKDVNGNPLFSANGPFNTVARNRLRFFDPATETSWPLNPPHYTRSTLEGFLARGKSHDQNVVTNSLIGGTVNGGPTHIKAEEGSLNVWIERNYLPLSPNDISVTGGASALPSNFMNKNHRPGNPIAIQPSTNSYYRPGPPDFFVGVAWPASGADVEQRANDRGTPIPLIPAHTRRDKLPGNTAPGAASTTKMIAATATPPPAPTPTQTARRLWVRLMVEASNAVGASLDGNSDPVRLVIEWGDGTFDQTPYVVAPYHKSPNHGIIAEHQYAAPSTYQVRVQLRDLNGAISSWSASKAVTVN